MSNVSDTHDKSIVSCVLYGKENAPSWATRCSAKEHHTHTSFQKLFFRCQWKATWPRGQASEGSLEFCQPIQSDCVPFKLCETNGF